MHRYGPFEAKRLLPIARRHAVPVLMYHRIADTGPTGLARYRIGVSQFEEHLAAFKKAGRSSAGTAELASWREGGLPADVAPLILTFDDGYEDFATAAAPLLARYGFFAEVFIVSDHVGGVASWDEAFGEPAKLMDWTAIEHLAASGTRFGSHLATHRSMNAMSDREIMDEGNRSREALENHLGSSVIAMAAPYGHLKKSHVGPLAAAGYRYAYSGQDGLATLDGDPFSINRIEVHPGTMTEVLVRRLENAT